MLMNSRIKLNRSVLSILLVFILGTGAAYSQVDVRHYRLNIFLSDTTDEIRGSADIEVRHLQASDSVVFDLTRRDHLGKGMFVSSVVTNKTKEPLRFSQTADKLIVYSSSKRGTSVQYTITYSGVPSDGLIISVNQFGQRTIFADNWPNRAHYWFPCIDHPSDKATVDFIVRAPSHYRIIANGIRKEERAAGNNETITRYEENTPIPTKVMVIGAAPFLVRNTGKVKGIPVSSWLFEGEKNVTAYDTAPFILTFFIRKIGPFSYKKLANVQSKTRFGGMENAGAIFYFEESPAYPGVESLVAHEIAHQWFGDAATEKDWSHVWLSEGFATYLSNVYLEDKYGPDSLRRLMTQQRNKVLKFEKKRFTPIIDHVQSDYMQILNANSYEKAAWVLHMLRREMGDAAFWKATRKYYKKYRNKNADTDDLLRIFEQVAGKDLDTFFNQWLYRAGNPKLTLNWRYRADSKNLILRVTQEQPELYQLPFEFSIPGEPGLRSVLLKDRVTTVEVPVASVPASVIPDPNVNLMAEIKEDPQR
ncbi:M1 family metallopeptidase [Arcticibacter tournemirensis]|uniref:Aminopeptidase N n=2 Tax=Arcticibacter tournemirensis TaxID=699437 RepID=A0A5M9HIR8_9SPHI|nr:M1 family metallopeptidase [Arcticibacter tournemirensis]